MKLQHEPPFKVYLRKSQVGARYGGIHATTVERMVKDGRLPPPIYRGRFPLWDRDELDAADRAATMRRTTEFA